MTGDWLAITLPAFALGGVLMAVGSRHVARDVARARWLKFAVFFGIVHVVLGAAALGRAAIAVLLALVVGAGARELAGAWRRLPAPRPARVWVVYGLVVGLVMANAVALPPAVTALLFLAAASFDGFSQVVGQWLGRTPLAPRVSPAKTVEGALGGTAAAIGVVLLLRATLQAGVAAAMGWGLVVALGALAGDLAKSWVKRRAGLKDFAATLPGQGGVLDRFDSFLAACAVAGTALRWAG
jgi:phosphatidate cytidylyltransferase